MGPELRGAARWTIHMLRESRGGAPSKAPCGGCGSLSVPTPQARWGRCPAGRKNAHPTLQAATLFEMHLSLPRRRPTRWKLRGFRGYIPHPFDRSANRRRRTQCVRESGEIGRRTRFRFSRGNPWGFESPLSQSTVRV